MRWSEEDYEQYKKGKASGKMKKIVQSKNKYNATKTTVDGIKFDSIGESRRYSELKLLERAGAISELELQPRFELQPSFKKNGKTIRAITYTADFKYINNKGKIVIEDFKGFETRDFKIRKKMFEYRYPELSLKVIK